MMPWWFWRIVRFFVSPNFVQKGGVLVNWRWFRWTGRPAGKSATTRLLAMYSLTSTASKGEQ
ncbi:hypothetical protein BKA80DRAFT_261732 [Phyllosticta citrichinensis]